LPAASNAAFFFFFVGKAEEDGDGWPDFFPLRAKMSSISALEEDMKKEKDPVTRDIMCIVTHHVYPSPTTTAVSTML